MCVCCTVLQFFLCFIGLTVKTKIPQTFPRLLIVQLNPLVFPSLFFCTFQTLEDYARKLLTLKCICQRADGQQEGPWLSRSSWVIEGYGMEAGTGTATLKCSAQLLREPSEPASIDEWTLAGNQWSLQDELTSHQKNLSINLVEKPAKSIGELFEKTPPQTLDLLKHRIMKYFCSTCNLP